MDIKSFLGVPHTQLNAYIHELYLYSRRAGRGNSSPIPVVPLLTLQSAQRDSATQLQESSIHARKYIALILSDVVGKTDKRTEKGDPMSVKTYGWRLIESETLANPYLVSDFSSSMCLGPEVSALINTVVVHLGLGAGTNDVLKGLLSGEIRAEMEWKVSPHETLVKSAWVCRNAEHDARVCGCGCKTKRVLVCAVKGHGMAVMPLRIDKYVWSPDAVAQVEAYAESAKVVVEKMMETGTGR
ncbi:hypothetical protein M011DRAFT_186416 [Sporormia fimetaria CBS 119925]|uniref:Uncharacterized protein n=1 Tax=Sporormia fimetaria CBS 119925 TaxID=1340428 RepID=A0A6A6VJT4_9PLEO|nr:hypothetical protein M011DRAFT_186416 [Sporormia fimetaria CBS 119925]